MLISLNEIKKLVPAAAEVETDELIKLIGSRLVEVEGKTDLSEKYNNIYIVKVVECEPIPDTHLHLCRIDAGAEKNAEFGMAETDGFVQVVCGAPNVHKGMLAVWLTPGAIVPQTFGEENFKLSVRPLRGYQSFGMLAGLDEIDLGDDHSGIVEIDPKMAQPGDKFADVFELNDVILDIENKSLTHRPDTFGLIGFAREVAGILGVPFDFDFTSFAAPLATTGASLRANPVTTGVSEASDAKDLEIKIESAPLCPRYSCAILEMSDALTDDKYLTKMDVFLAKAGMRGISKIVDVTNYLMLMTGQPLHAFDYDKFLKVGGSKDAKIIVRTAKSGETLQLLDGKTIECNENDILITSNDVPVALAGAMGGASTEIDTSTTRVLLESATFSLYNMRKTQMSHGIFSEAITRFTKGQPAGQTMPVLNVACSMFGGKVVAVADNYAVKSEQKPIRVSVSEINALLGTDYDKETIVKTLANVGLACKDSERTLATTGASLRANPVTTGVSEASREEYLAVENPYWRTDLHIKEDLIEEVGRLLGYDNIALTFPTRPFIGAEEDTLLKLKSAIRSIMSDKLASHEILTYSFVSKKLQETVGEDPEDSYEIVNSISPELQRFRQSLTPSLLEKLQMNQKAGYKDFSLYEINQVTKKSLSKDKDGVPNMETHLAFAVTGDFYTAKAYLNGLAEALNLDTPDYAELKTATYLEKVRSASVKIGETEVGQLGEIKQPVLKRLKIEGKVAVFELNLEKLLEITPKIGKKVKEISKFPPVERDLTLKVAAKTPFKAVESVLKACLEKTALLYTLTPISVYQASDASKNLSFRLKFADKTKTLSSDEISAIMEEVANSAKTEVGAEVI